MHVLTKYCLLTLFARRLVLTSLLVFLSAESVRAGSRVRTVALSDGPVLGIDEELNFGHLELPVINGSGQVAFRTALAGPLIDIGQQDAIFSEGGGKGLELVAREGDPLSPSTTVNTFGSLDDPLLSNSGHTVFSSLVRSQTDSLSRGIFRSGDAGNLQLVVSDQQAAPGVEPGVVFTGVGSPLLNDQGDIAFLGTLRRGPSQIAGGAGLFRASPSGVLELVVRRGDVAPGTGGTGRYGGHFSFREPALNNRGKIALLDEVEGQGTGRVLDRGIFLADSRDDASLVALVADPAPEAEELAYFQSLGRPALNDSSHIAFAAVLGGSPIDAANQFALYSNAGDNGLELIARQAKQAPGAEPGAFFASFGDPVLNRGGQAAFSSRLQGDGIDRFTSDAIYKQDTDGELVIVARAGEAAPITAKEFIFGGRTAFGNDVSINAHGQTAFLGFLLGFESAAGKKGIFAEDRDGTLRAIAYTDQLFDVSDDPLAPDLRTIADLSFVSGSGNEDGRRRGFNDAGQLAFWASFTDGTSGVFVSTAVAIPEPSALALFVCGCVIVSLQWKAR